MDKNTTWLDHMITGYSHDDHTTLLVFLFKLSIDFKCQLYCSILYLCRCSEPAECVPVFENSAIINLPVVGDSGPLKIIGRCVEPCESRCVSDPADIQCGTDGRTYTNSCYRMCASSNVQVSRQCTTWEGHVDIIYFM